MTNVLHAGPLKQLPVSVDDAPSVVNVGISRKGPCGVRDFGRVLGRALHDLGSDVRSEWLDADAAWGARELRAETRHWLDRTDAHIEATRPDWILWHYSVFSYSYHGLPLLSDLSAARLAKSGVPVVGVLHEFAYPFGARKLRDLTFAVSHRVVLRSVFKHLAAAVVTTDDRLEWLRSRRWLADRPVFSAPVFANTTLRAPAFATQSPETVVGIIGFASDRYLIEPVVQAIGLVARDRDIRLLLIGSPGPDSPQGQRWRVAAERSGFGDRIAFTGVLDPESYAAAIESVDVVVLPDADGPSSRKGTLAAALAAAKPIVATDGVLRWDLLADERAAVLVPRDPRSIADAVALLCDDFTLRAEQGRRAEAFYRRHQAADIMAQGLLNFLAEQHG